jgi:hypothetical protein
MRTQFDELKELLGRRKIDALIMSIGGNDAGFANAASALVMDNFDDERNKRHLLRAIKTGDWHRYTKTLQLKGLFKHFDSKHNGLDGLPEQYAKIARVIDRDFVVSKVYITEYPDPSTYRESVSSSPSTGQSGNRHRELTRREIQENPDLLSPLPRHPTSRSQNITYPTCAQVLNRISDQIAPEFLPIDGVLEIDRDELNWVKQHLLGPLNQAVFDATKKHGWIYVDGIKKSFNGHGLCVQKPYRPELYKASLPVRDRTKENIRFFRAGIESYTIQGSECGRKGIEHNTAVIHPNEFGHLIVKNRIRDKMILPTVMDREVCSPCDSRK